MGGQATGALQLPAACPLCCVTWTGLDCDPYRPEGHQDNVAQFRAGLLDQLSALQELELQSNRIASLARARLPETDVSSRSRAEME